MNAWTVSCPDGDGGAIVRYTSNEAAARKVRQQLVDEVGAKKRGISIAPLYIVPGKDELIAFLNGVEQRHDGREIATYYQPEKK